MTPDRRRLSYLLAVAFMSMIGCSGSLSDAAGLSSLDPAATQIEYRFNDSSLPPEYHRSYTVTADEGQVHIVVDSYGDVLHDETAALDDQTWLTLLSAAKNLGAVSSGEQDECPPGSTSRDLLISEAGDTPLLEIRGVCEEQGSTEVQAIDTFVAPLLELFDMETLLAPAE